MNTIYLIGNSNVGKTTLFNALTTSRKKTGNYIGTTLSSYKKSVTNPKYSYFSICDIAGVYNFEDKKGEEIDAWNTIETAMEDDSAIFVQVIDPKYWKKSLSLTLDLQAKGITPVLLCNIRNQNKKKVEAFCIKISEEFGCTVVVENISKMEDIAFQENFFSIIQQEKIDKKIDKKIHKNIIKTFANFQEKNIYLTEFCKKYEDNRDNKDSKDNLNSAKKYDWLDSLFLDSFFGVLIFFILLYFIFEITFTLGAIPMDWIDGITSLLQGYGNKVLPDTLWSSVLIDGLLAGVGGTLIFLPNIAILFFFLSVLKESGYLARTSFLFNVFFQKLGLSGRASVPLLMGFGCNVPSIMAIKMFPTRKEQVIVAMMSLFMSCGARLPVYILLLGVFVSEDYQASVLFGIYLLGLVMSFVTGKILHSVYKRKEVQALQSYEIPELTMPSFVTALQEAWLKSVLFIKKVGVFIVPVSIILWGMFTFPQSSEGKNTQAINIESSYGASIGKFIQPIFSPMEFDWKISTALLSGIAAKEVMVTTFSQLYHATNENESLQENIKNSGDFSIPTAFALIVFILLYTPCLSVIGVIRSELGNLWALFSIIYPFILAWIVSFFTFEITRFLL